MDTNESINAALETLQLTEQSSAEHPAMIFFPPDSGKFIVGNRDGYVQLAIASLKAAQGSTQSFKEAPWVAEVDLDWALAGLQYDPSAHIYLPPKQTTWGRFWNATAPLVLAVCFIVGVGTIVYGLIHLFIR